MITLVWWRVASLGSQTNSTSFLYSSAEDSLKDGHRLKHLLLKALTLMLDAAESYAKVTMESLIPDWFWGLVSRNYFVPGLFQVKGGGATGQLGAKGEVQLLEGSWGNDGNSLHLCIPPPSLRTPACDRPCTVTGSPSC